MGVKVTTGEPDIGVGGWDIQTKEIDHELIVIKASVVGIWRSIIFFCILKKISIPTPCQLINNCIFNMGCGGKQELKW